MALSGSDFPRGGKRSYKEEKGSSVDKDLFQTKDGKPVSKKRKLAGRKQERQGASRQKKQRQRIMSKSHAVEPLTFQSLTEGQLVLGVVKEVHDYKVVMSLPNGLLGIIPIADVSQAYTHKLHAVAEASDADILTEDVPSLKDLFHMADAVPCRVLATKMEGMKRQVDLSADPREVNKGMPLTALKAGMLLYGAVSSMEEHGYMIDLGIPGIQAFLQTDSQQEVSGLQLPVGKGVWCTLQMEAGLDIVTGETRVVQVTVDCTVVQQAQARPQMVTSVDCLRPGIKVLATVDKVLDSGLRVKCFQYGGSIHKSHLPHGTGHYRLGQKVEARILYTHPVSKMISLSLLPGIMTCVGRGKEEAAMYAGLSVGDVIDQAEVQFVDKACGVFFKLHQFVGKATLQHLCGNKKVKDLNKVFPQGSKHRCRIIGFHPADDVVLVSLKQSVMQQEFLTVSDIHPGEIVECKVHQFHTSGLIVSLGKSIMGLVPRLHIADVPLQHFEKKFTKGDKLTCRVLKVDAKRNRLLLCNKKSIVTTSLSVPTSYKGLTRDTELEGWILSVKDHGVVVGFCNQVMGWVPRSELSTIEISHPAAVFYPGQVVRCRVLSCHPDTERLKLSLIISGKAPLSAPKAMMEDFEVGKLMEAVVMKKLGSNMEVKLQPCGTKALLPKHHLADSADNQELLWQSLEPGNILDTVMLFKQTDIVIVTKKESFISAAREGLIPTSFADIEPGQFLPGVVKNHQSYGIFVELPGGLSGLVPRKFTMDQPAPDLTIIFSCGQSVVVKVIEVKPENSRFLCSLRMCDCFHDDPRVCVELLETYFAERAQSLASVLDEKAQRVKVGSIVLVEVVKATDDGYLCQTDLGMTAILLRLHAAEGDLQVGAKIESVVLHIDPVTPVLEVSSDRSLVHAVSRRAEKPNMDKACVGQRIKAEVLLVKEDFVLVALKQHAVGTLAFLPTRQHLNDVLAKNGFSIGETTHVIIQKYSGDIVLANLESRIPAALAKKGKLVRERHDLQQGQVVTAQVQAIHPYQMNIKIGKVSGRVHVTEMADDLENGASVFSAYMKGQDIKVKIIGFRNLQTLKYLPISHPRVHKAMPECSLKPSKLAHTDCPPEDLASFEGQYKKGDKVLVFPIKFESSKLWVNVSPTVHGVIPVFDLSSDLGVLQHAEKHFLPGHGYRATVMGVEEEGLLHLSLTGKKETVQKRKLVTGKVTSVTNKGIFLRLPGDYRGCVPLADEQDNAAVTNVSVGLFVRCRVISCFKKDNCILSMGAHMHRKRTSSSSLPVSPPMSPSPTRKEAFKQKQQEKKQSLLSELGSKVAELTSPPHTTVADEQGLESSAVPVMEQSVRGYKESRLQLSDGFIWEEPHQSADKQDESSCQEEEEAPKKKKKKTTYENLELTADSNKPKDYDKLLLSRPNDSMLWIEYMSEHLNAGDIDRARAVGEQALKTISFREEQDKMNVWIALLNLENLYGSKEQVAQVFRRALQVNDSLTLYRRVASMYTASGKMEEAEQTYQTMVRKFKQVKQVWADFGLFLYKQGRLDAARNLLQRSLLSLERRDHVDIIVKFAQLEFGYGETERASTMFEKIIAEFPRRSDIMSIYIDMVVKSGDHDKAREIFERAVTSTKRTKFFFQKYLTFEEKYGTEESVARVKEKIESYC